MGDTWIVDITHCLLPGGILVGGPAGRIARYFNQGIRYVLLSALLELDAKPDLLKELFELYPDDGMADWLYGPALDAFRREGDTAISRKLLSEAKKANPYVPAYLLGKKQLPKRLPDYVGLGDEREAVSCAAEYRKVWRRTSGALEWLERAGR